MAKIVSKGTVVKQDISSTLTAIAQVLSFSHTGAEVQTFDGTTLDSGTGKVYLSTGYVEGGSCEFELFFDPDLTGHQALTDDLLVPPAAGRNYSVEFADATPSVWEWTSAGMSFGITVAMNDGLKATVTSKLTGLMAYDT